jgi:glycosyltransferase involved in cell wall biosynthesis
LTFLYLCDIFPNKYIPEMMKNILILNRRCIRHPEKGGAEIYTFELAKALKEEGAIVEWCSSRPRNLKRREELDGIKFIRKGSEFTSHFYGLLYALEKRDWLIIDEFNGIGFFTFFMKNSIVLIHQLYDGFWTAEFGFMGYFFRFLEKLLLRLYKKKATITISPSTYKDLRQLGFRDITIIYSGVDLPPLDPILEKEKTLTLIFLGRLKNTKKPQDAMKALLLIRRTIHDAKLWIVGEGPLIRLLKTKYGNIEGIHFWGFVNDQEKYELLKKAHLLLVPSIREGWGLAVMEANAVGTPAIGFHVKGLQDSIKDGKTGLLVRDYKDMVLSVIDLWTDRYKYKAMSKNALDWANHFPWEKTKKEFISFITKRGLR